MAASRCDGAKWLAKANGRPSIAASWALNVLEPSNHIGIFSPSPGVALTLVSGCALVPWQSSCLFPERGPSQGQSCQDTGTPKFQTALLLPADCGLAASPH